MKFTPFRWWTHSTLPVEALSGLIAWYWAVVFFLPGNLLLISPVYKTLIYIYPQDWLWAGIMAILGLGHTLSVCFSVEGLRTASLAFATFVWTFLAVTFAISIPLSVSPGLLGLLGLFSLWGWYRADREHNLGR